MHLYLLCGIGDGISDWPLVVVTVIQTVIAGILGWIAINQYSEGKRERKKAFVVAHAKKLSETGFGIEIYNQVKGPATNVETLINGKPISESKAIIKTSKISNIAPKDWITYRIYEHPSLSIKVSISWTDGTGEKSHYEKDLIFY